MGFDRNNWLRMSPIDGAEPGDAEPGYFELGDSEPSNPKPSDSEPGNPETSDSELGNPEPGNSEPGISSRRLGIEKSGSSPLF